MKDSISVQVRNREKILFADEARAVTAYNLQGVFDVLPQHANFISLIKDKIVIRKIGDSTQEILIKSGILKVWENQVKIFLDVESPLT